MVDSASAECNCFTPFASRRLSHGAAAQLPSLDNTIGLLRTPVALPDDLREQVAFLTAFKNDIRAYQHQWNDQAMRTRINKGMPRARQIVGETGTSKTITLSPPPAVGGLLVKNADPFSFILQDYYGMTTTDVVSDIIDEAIGVLETPGHAERLKKRQDASAARTSKPSDRSAATNEPELPAKVTVIWMIRHVPVTFWLWAIGILAAVFALGAKYGPFLLP